MACLNDYISSTTNFKRKLLNITFPLLIGCNFCGILLAWKKKKFSARVERALANSMFFCQDILKAQEGETYA
jgi:hypothetical protein